MHASSGSASPCCCRAAYGSDGYSTLVNGIRLAAGIPFFVANLAVSLVFIALAALTTAASGHRNRRPGGRRRRDRLGLLAVLDEPSGHGPRLLLLAVSIPVLALGIAAYLGSQTGAGPAEGAALAWDPPVPLPLELLRGPRRRSLRRVAAGRGHRRGDRRGDPSCWGPGRPHRALLRLDTSQATSGVPAIGTTLQSRVTYSRLDTCCSDPGMCSPGGSWSRHCSAVSRSALDPSRSQAPRPTPSRPEPPKAVEMLDHHRSRRRPSTTRSSRELSTSRWTPRCPQAPHGDP